MRELNGSELAGFIKERQAKTVRGLRQAWGVEPKLAIIVTTQDPVIDMYIKLKQKYASDILIDTEVYRVKQDMVPELLDEVRKDNSIHGVILQLPLDDPSQTDRLCALIPASKDVDGLGGGQEYISATATAIDWLINGYGVNYTGKKIVIVGQGKLVGAPYRQLLESSGLKPVVADENTPDIKKLIAAADILVTATGSPGCITGDMIKSKAVVVDAGVATDNGKLVGDLADDVYDREDLTITPRKGGVGPLTIAALFDNLIVAARGGRGNLAPEE